MERDARLLRRVHWGVVWTPVAAGSSRYPSLVTTDDIVRPILTSASRKLAVAASFLFLLAGCRELRQETASSDNVEVQGRGEGKDQWWEALPRAAWSSYTQIVQSQPWFEVYEVFSGVFAIYEPGQFEEVISYLILGGDRALLFDTGIGVGDMRALVSELTSLPVVVLNSHTHYDHVGGNHAFDDIYGTATEYTQKHSAGREHAEVAEFVGEGWIWKPTPEGFDRSRYQSLPFTITKIVEDGESIDLGGLTLEVLWTPGHAPDSLCLLDRANRRLFTGDTFYPASLYSHLEGSDFWLYEESATRLAELAPLVDYVLPAHNEPVLEGNILQAFGAAFVTVQQDAAAYVLTDGYREYDFDRFSLIVTEPPPWKDSQGTPTPSTGS